MEAIASPRNLRVHVLTDEDLSSLRQQKWTRYTPPAPIQLLIQGRPHAFRPGLTLTPFANPVPCNAHCRFCSEDLQRRDGHQLTAKRLIADQGAYFAALDEALSALRGLPMGLSLSGLEATADPAWLRGLLDLLSQHPDAFDEKVLYTNGSGLARHPWMAQALADLAFDRIELSRCHPEQATNQAIMAFNRTEPVWQNAPYEALVRSLHPTLLVKNSCILTQPGVHDLEGMEAYLDWAIGLGVREVVFRELSRLDDTYLPNATARWVEANRVPIEPLLQAISPSMSGTRPGWQHLGATLGYYYYNEHFRYKGQAEVVIETSSYPALISATADTTIHKLVFHSNGNLCGDWDPNARIIAQWPL